MLDHYFIGLVFFLLLTYGAVWYFMGYVLREFYTVKKSRAYHHWLTAFSLLVLLAGMPEPSSFFTWLAADTTYLISFILFLFYLVKLHQVFIVPRVGRKVTDRVLLMLLAGILMGTNEMALLFSMLISFLLCGYRFFSGKDRSLFVVALPLLYVVIIVLVLFRSGNVQRSGAYMQKQFWLFSLTGAFYQTLQIFHSIFSSPVCWLALVWAVFNSEHVKARLTMPAGRRVALFGGILVLLFAAVCGLCFAARHFAGIVLPFRARNIIVSIVLPGILAAAVLLIGPLLRVSWATGETAGRRTLFLLAGTGVLVFNSFTAGLCQSLVDAPIHHEVLNNRIARLREASARGQQKVVFNTYRNDFLAVMKNEYGRKAALFFNVEYPPPPRLLYFLDDPSELVMGGLYGEYYGIDTVRMNNVVAPRAGLTPGVWQQWRSVPAKAENKSRQ